MKCPFCNEELTEARRIVPTQKNQQEAPSRSCAKCKIMMPTSWWLMQEKRLSSLPRGDRD